MIKFSQRLRELRKKAGLSQQEFANQIGTSKSSINMYERGEREPSLEMLEAIADYFNVDMDYLLGKSDIKNRFRGSLSAPRRKREFELASPVDFAARLNSAMEGRNITCEELSKKAGVSETTLKRYLSGKWDGRSDVAYDIAEALDVRLGWLLGNGEDDFSCAGRYTGPFEENESEAKLLEPENEEIQQLFNVLAQRSDIRNLVVSAIEAPPGGIDAAIAMLKALKASENAIK